MFWIERLWKLQWKRTSFHCEFSPVRVLTWKSRQNHAESVPGHLLGCINAITTGESSVPGLFKRFSCFFYYLLLISLVLYRIHAPHTLVLRKFRQGSGRSCPLIRSGSFSHPFWTQNDGPSFRSRSKLTLFSRQNYKILYSYVKTTVFSIKTQVVCWKHCFWHNFNVENTACNCGQLLWLN